MGWLAWIILVALVGAVIWVRVAPVKAAVWHVALNHDADSVRPGGVLRIIDGDQTRFEALDRIILETPRTEGVAGSVASGHRTYVTRSALWGFPDFTTVHLQDGHIRIWGRLRFGKSDLGVNKARVSGWLEALQAR